MRIDKTVRVGLRYGKYHDAWDSVNISWPLGTLEMNQDILRVKYNFLLVKREYIFSRDDVIAFERWQGFFSRGILIKHYSVNAPHFFVLWPFNRNQLLDILTKWLK